MTGGGRGSGQTVSTLDLGKDEGTRLHEAAARIYAPRGNTLQAAAGDVPDATFDILAFSGTVLGDKSDDRQAVLVWARAMATKGEVGGSVAEFCRRTRWSRAKFDRRRIKACEKIAAAKNAI